MAKFLIDANLPRKIMIWSGKEFLHIHNIDSRWEDSNIWSFAKDNNLTIITKDSDFSYRMLKSEPPPKVIHFSLGNIKFQELETFLELKWYKIRGLSENHKLVNVHPVKITAIA